MKVIRLALRSVLHFKTYTGINILGLALSLACVIVIFRYVHGELTVDHFNKKLDRIYITTRESSKRSDVITFFGIENRNNETTFVNLTEHPGIEKFSSFYFFENEEIDLAERKLDATILVADSNFFNIFDYTAISGNAKLVDPTSALITKSFAQKTFENQDPIGKTFLHSSGKLLTINGILEQPSTKSSLSFDIIISSDLSNRWSSASQTIALLHSSVDYQYINKQYGSFFEMPLWKEHLRYQLYPLSKVYFNKNIVNRIFKQGNHIHVMVLTVVGVLILLIGIINFINIYTVVILKRGREFGMKKVFGAEGYNLFAQLLSENLVMTGLALAMAWGIIALSSAWIENILQLNQVTNTTFDATLSLSIFILLPLLTSLFPFFRYHYISPIHSLRDIDRIKSSGSLHRIFLLFQYIITITMIVVSLFFIKQLHFMLNTDPGYRTKDIIKTQMLKRRYTEKSQESWEKEYKTADEIIQRMNESPLFNIWTYGRSPNQLYNSGIWEFKLPDGEFQQVVIFSSNEAWMKLFDIQLKEGRIWNDSIDNSRNNFLIVTESALKLFNINNYSDVSLYPSQRIISYFDMTIEEMNTVPAHPIIGVVKDFNYLHLSEKSKPIVFYYTSGFRYDQLMASIIPSRTQEAIEFLKKLHEETVGGEFIYSFVDDEVRAMYQEDKKIATIYSIFTVIAILISALGLFSMSLFDIQQRRKEIAIRKVNGATILDIIRVLLKKYFLLLGLSFAIASPIALFAIHRYLEGFAHKAPISWWLFAVALIITSGISLLTLIYQTHKAANENPAEVVKAE